MIREGSERLPHLSAVPALLVGIAVAITLAVAVALLFFAHPLGDDFCNAVNVRELGLLEAVRREYLHWGGRWAGHVVVVLFPALFEITRWYPLGIGVVLAVGLGSLRFLIGTVLPLRDEPRLAWSLTLVLGALYWAGMPAPGQTVYWFEGASVYSLNLSLSIVLVACLIRLPEAPSARRSAAVAGLALLAAVVAAFHELFALVLGAVLVVGAGIAWMTRDARRVAWAAAAAGAGVGLLSVVLAPGNEVRQPELNPEGLRVDRAVLATLQMWLRVLDAPVAGGDRVSSHVPLGWLVDARLLAATVLLATAPRLAVLRPAWLARWPRPWRAVVPVVGLAILSGGFLAGGLALGRTLPLRAFNALYLVFLLGWFLSVLVYASTEEPSGEPSAGLRTVRLVSALVLAVGLLASSNFKYGLRDLARGRVVAFDRAMAERHGEARRLAARRGGELVAAAIEPWPSSYFRNDVGDVSPPLRECIARYFGLDSVRPAEPGNSAPASPPKDRRSTTSPP